jgi:RNA polymerase sigma-70 factor (ECF subfamily)
MRSDELVRRARAGHVECREDLARVWLGPVYATALALTGRTADAEDLAQEAFLRAFRSLATLRRPAGFGPWILQIVRNAWRDARRRPTPPHAVADPPEPAAPEETNADAPTDGVAAAFSRLSAEERMVCWLKVVEGWTVRDIAALLSRSKSTVDRTFRRALETLRTEVR